MLSDRARIAVGYVMAIGCALKFYPFTWDRKSFRLKPAGLFHRIIWNIHGYTNCIMGTFAIVRFMLALKFQVFPARIRILNFAWSLVYSLGIVCFIQFKLNRKQILAFANSIFEYLDKCKQEELETMPSPTEDAKDGQDNKESTAVAVVTSQQQESMKKFKPKRSLLRRNRSFLRMKKNSPQEGQDWVSICVLWSVFLLAVNPPIHAIMVVDSPCAPHFVSSIGLPCTHILENFTFFEKIPYILVEMLLTSVFFSNFTFSWVFVFLGLAQVKYELRKMNSIDRNNCTEEEILELPERFRLAQNLIAQMNSSFVHYLRLSPSILMGVVALLAFGAIRYYNLHFTAYMMYPLCGGRCLFDTITCLGIAGMVNDDSHHALKKWDKILADGGVADSVYRKVQRLVWKSCSQIQCKAGSLYTFQNTIVIATVHNCMQLTFNLLIMYR